jgi:hypothetical protein
LGTGQTAALLQAGCGQQFLFRRKSKGQVKYRGRKVEEGTSEKKREWEKCKGGQKEGQVR